MRFLCTLLVFSFITAVEAAPNISFQNEARINAHTLLIEVALGHRLLPENIKHRKEVEEAVKAYTAVVSTPRFHLLFSNNDAAELSSMLLNSASLEQSHCPSLCSTLQNFMPVFETTLWQPLHASNALWINKAKVLLQKYGNEIEVKLNEYFNTPLIPLSHTIYVVENIDKGATTSGRQPTSIMSSGNAEYQQFKALEMIYHEVAHTYASSRKGKFRKTVNDVFGDSALVPRDLWHAIHFYTVGYAVQSVLNEEGLHYTPYAHTNGLYTGRWSEVDEYIEAYWVPYLEGKRTMKEALNEMKQHIATVNSTPIHSGR